MEQLIREKILSLDELIKAVEGAKARGKVVVQSHGVFDIIHPGMIKHLNSAKKQGDILIVTVIKDKDVRKGPGRPIFTEGLRAENVASLQYVDYICIVDDEVPFECVKRIKPDVFAKGQSQKERDEKIHKKIFEEEKELYFGKSKIYETGGFSFSASQIINNFLDIYPEETKNFLKKFQKNYSFGDIAGGINSLKKLKVLLIGDGIIDEYHYCDPLGKSAKANIVVNRYLSHEVFAGGIFAIANHLAGLCDDIQLVTLLGDNDSREDFVLNNLKPNIKTKFFYRNDGPTIVKKRYFNQYLNQKLFEINFLNTQYINSHLESSIIEYIKSQIPSYDFVLVSDFGHGFITNNIIKGIEAYSKKIVVNVQTNAANAGYNMITKYSNPFYVCLDEPEVRISAQERYANIEDVAIKVKNLIDADYLIVTLGKKGSIGINKGNEINRTPVFSTKVIDTVGAGDAFFAFTAPCFALGLPLNVVSFIGNAAGALAVQIVGNKKAVEKYELLEFIHALLK